MLPILQIVIDPEVDSDRVLLPARLEAQLGDRVWLAPADALFEGRRFAAEYGETALPRLPPDHGLRTLFDLVILRDHPWLADASEPKEPDRFVGLEELSQRFDKTAQLDLMRRQLTAVHKAYDDGLITDGERYNKAIDVISATAETVGYHARRALPERLRQMPDHLLRQTFGMPGLVAKVSGEIQERAIINSAADGRDVHEFFLLATDHRGRAVRRQARGRRVAALWGQLVRSIGDVVITDEDCGTDATESFRVDGWVPLVGRTLPKPIVSPWDGQTLVDAGPLTQPALDTLMRAGMWSVSIRSALHCVASGLCRRCYGAGAGAGERIGATASRRLARVAREIRERTWRCSGGLTEAPTFPVETILRLGSVDVVRSPNDPHGNTWVVMQGGTLRVETRSGELVQALEVPVGARLNQTDGELCAAHEPIGWWGIGDRVVLARRAGVVELPTETAGEELDEITGLPYHRMVGDGFVSVGGQRHAVPDGALLRVADGDFVRRGAILAVDHRRVVDIYSSFELLVDVLEATPPREDAVVALRRGVVTQVTPAAVWVDDVPYQRPGVDSRWPRAATVLEGDRVEAGDRLFDGGDRNLGTLFSLMPRARFRRHLLEKLNEAIGCNVNPADLELVVMAMTRGDELTGIG